MPGPIVWLVAALLLAPPAWAAEGDAPETAVTGELVDVKCYATMGLRGAIHQECAVKCAKEHWPVGVLEETSERLYPLVVPSAAVADAMGQRVRVTGTVALGGVWLLPSRLEVEREGVWADVVLPSLTETP